MLDRLFDNVAGVIKKPPFLTNSAATRAYASVSLLTNDSLADFFSKLQIEHETLNYYVTHRHHPLYSKCIGVYLSFKKLIFILSNRQNEDMFAPKSKYRARCS